MIAAKALLLALLAPFAPDPALGASAEQSQATPQHKMPDTGSVHWMGDERIGMRMYPGMAALDLIGPQSMFGS